MYVSYYGAFSCRADIPQVNGSACSQNSKLINGILKDELGFQGFVMTDWLTQIGGVSSALAGLDMAMPGDGPIPLFGDSYWGSELSRAVLNGTVPVDRLNDMVCICPSSVFIPTMMFFVPCHWGHMRAAFHCVACTAVY